MTDVPHFHKTNAKKDEFNAKIMEQTAGETITIQACDIPQETILQSDKRKQQHNLNLSVLLESFFSDSQITSALWSHSKHWCIRWSCEWSDMLLWNPALHCHVATIQKSAVVKMVNHQHNMVILWRILWRQQQRDCDLSVLACNKYPLSVCPSWV